MSPIAPKTPAAMAQPSPAAGDWAPDATAAASMTSAPTGTDTAATDSALLCRLAAPPRKSALPYKTAAASANTITMTQALPWAQVRSPLGYGRNNIPHGSID